MSQAGALKLVSGEEDFSYSSHYWKNVKRIVEVMGKACTKRYSEIKEICTGRITFRFLRRFCNFHLVF